MLRQNKLKILLSSLITLIPMLMGCILWNRLPDTVATHFDTSNAANGWSSKPFAVFGIPVIMVGLHLLCLFLTSVDPKYKNIGKKPLGIVFWIIPTITLVMYSVIYGIALGIALDVGFVCCLLIGVLFIVLGNVLPKARQNYTFGIKVPWTLNDTENWNRTHRLAGWCMVLAGIIITATSFWHNPWVLIGVLAAAVVIPIIYSYTYHKHCQK